MSYVDIIDSSKQKRMIGSLNEETKEYECKLINITKGGDERSITLNQAEMSATLFIVSSDEDRVTGLTLTMYSLCEHKWKDIPIPFRMIP